MSREVFAVPELPIDAVELARVSDDLRTKASDLPTAGSAVAGGWTDLSEVYEAPEVEELRTKMSAVAPIAADVAEAVRRAASIIDGLAENLMWLAMRRRGLLEDVEGFTNSPRGSGDRERSDELTSQIRKLGADIDELVDRARVDLAGLGLPPTWEVTIPDATAPPVGPRVTWATRAQTASDDLVMAPLLALARGGTSRVARLLAARPEWADLLRERPPAPGAVRAWWDTLPPGAVAALIDGAPTVIGSLGGVPPLARVAANRGNARERLREVEAEIPGWELASTEGASADLQAERRAALAALGAERDYFRAVEAGKVQLYLYEPEANRIIEMLGTPGPVTSRILTYVPGTFTRVDSFYRGEVQGVSKWMSDQDRAMVAFVWKGTDFPGDDEYAGQTGMGIGLLEANDPDRAAPAGEALARFQREVASDPALAHGRQLAAGHSWGLVPLTASEMQGSHYDQVHSLSGAWVPDGWTPNSRTSYSHWSYTDALSMAQDALLVSAGRAPDTVTAFDSHIYERTTDADVPLGGDLAPFLDPDGPSQRVSLSPLGNHNLIAEVSDENRIALNDLKERLFE
ncbi:MAG: hypothetical protein PIR02_14525 [Microbacterium enclense]